MKYFATLLAIVLSLPSASCQDRAAVSLTFDVEDDIGMPVEGAIISTQMFDYWKPGGGTFGQDKYKMIDVTTGANGKAALSEKTSRCELVIIARKEGYYNGATSFKSITARAGMWQPTQQVLPILLKRKLNAIPLFAKRVEAANAAWLDLPADQCSYDMDVGDWVAPHGKGMVADLVFTLTNRYFPEKTGLIRDAKFTVTFSNPLDGLIIHDSSKDLPSALLMPYLAPETGYLPSMSWRDTVVAGPAINEKPSHKVMHQPNAPKRHLFLRVRTKVDKDGKIISANYAKVHRGIEWGGEGVIKFQYHYNPTPNDRNLEFDPKKNLFPAPKDGKERWNSPPPVTEP